MQIKWKDVNKVCMWNKCYLTITVHELAMNKHISELVIQGSSWKKKSKINFLTKFFFSKEIILKFETIIITISMF